MLTRDVTPSGLCMKLYEIRSVAGLLESSEQYAVAYLLGINRALSDPVVAGLHPFDASPKTWRQQLDDYTPYTRHPHVFQPL